jgi:hypothetical protein
MRHAPCVHAPTEVLRDKKNALSHFGLGVREWNRRETVSVRCVRAALIRVIKSVQFFTIYQKSRFLNDFFTSN